MSQPVDMPVPPNSAGGATPSGAILSTVRTVIPLADVQVGQEVILAAVAAGRNLQHRLAEMGLRCGVRFILISRGKPGPFILGIGDMRLVLGHGMAQSVTVYPVAG